jgi:hypothetical protein
MVIYLGFYKLEEKANAVQALGRGGFRSLKRSRFCAREPPKKMTIFDFLKVKRRFSEPGEGTINLQTEIVLGDP